MKRTKKELAERKAKAEEIAAMYVTVANGGRMEELISKSSGKWIASNGPALNNDLSYYRAIPAPKKP